MCCRPDPAPPQTFHVNIAANAGAAQPALPPGRLTWPSLPWSRSSSLALLNLLALLGLGLPHLNLWDWLLLATGVALCVAGGVPVPWRR